MTRQSSEKTAATLDIFHKLIQQNISRFSILLRHSERYYAQDPDQEPFMGLTPAGRDLAYQFGRRMPSAVTPRFFSSFIGRCLETAYLIDKGFTIQTGAQLPHTESIENLSPFYVKSIPGVVDRLKNQTNNQFLRDWFDQKIDTDIIDHPVMTADRICEQMIDQAKKTPSGHIALCISHDWNIYPVKEFKLGLAHETAGDVGYLEGLFFYELEKEWYLLNHQAGPVKL